LRAGCQAGGLARQEISFSKPKVITWRLGKCAKHWNGAVFPRLSAAARRGRPFTRGALRATCPP
jgi:hypothetical protein